MKRHDLFISHSSGDAESARELRVVLEAAGHTCWMAPDDVTGTSTWVEQILEAIETSRAMIVLVSARANSSSHVSREVNLALGKQHPVLPIRIERVGPQGNLEYLLALVQRLDAFPPPMASHSDAILRRVQAILGDTDHAATAAPAKAGTPADPVPLQPTSVVPLAALAAEGPTGALGAGDPLAFEGTSPELPRPPASPGPPPMALVDPILPPPPAGRAEVGPATGAGAPFAEGRHRRRRGLAVAAGAGVLGVLALAGIVAFGGLLPLGAATPTPSLVAAARVVPNVTASPDVLSGLLSFSTSPSPTLMLTPIPSPVPTPSPSPSPTPTPRPTPTLRPTPAPDTAGPTGGKIALAAGKPLTTSLKVSLAVPTKPFDASGVTWMAISNTSKRPTKSPGLRRYDNSFTWTLAGAKAGKRTVYVWFRDGSKKGNWSGPVTDTITFDNAPNAFGHTWHLENNSYYCAQTSLVFTIPGYAASDKDGNSTLTVLDAWSGSTHYPHSRTTVTVGVDTKPYSLKHHSFSFKVKDDHDVTDTGVVDYYVGPCP